MKRTRFLSGKPRQDGPATFVPFPRSGCAVTLPPPERNRRSVLGNGIRAIDSQHVWDEVMRRWAAEYHELPPFVPGSAAHSIDRDRPYVVRVSPATSVRVVVGV